MADITQERNFCQQGLENLLHKMISTLVAAGTVWEPSGIVLQYDL